MISAEVAKQALAVMTVPALAQSVAGFTWIAMQLRKTGGKVQVAALALPDLMASTVLAVFFVQLAVRVFLMPKTPLKGIKPEQILAEPFFLLIISVGLAGFLVFRRISLAEIFGWKRMPLWQMALGAVALTILALPAILTVSNLMAYALPKAYSEEQQLVALFRAEVRQGHYAMIASIFVAAVVLAPLGEEFLFRGYFYPVYKRYFGGVPSAVLTAVLFALLHANVVSFAGLFLLALCWTIAYEYSGSLLVPIAMHATFNFLNLAQLYLQASGTLP